MREFRLVLFLFVFCLLSKFSIAQSVFSHGLLKESASGHALQFEDGTPFFWLGDTGWELFHRLNMEESELYLKDRSKKGFNVIQAVVLAEFDGLHKPNRNGDVPFVNDDPAKPNEKYFSYVDRVIAKAATYNLFIGLLPTWGDKVTPLWGTGPAIFTTKNAYAYGLFIGKRYAKAPNVLWILGGDRPALRDTNDWRPIWREMAKGILDGTGQRAFITYHPSGGSYSTSQYIHNENWLNMNMVQSGHGGGHDVSTWEYIKRDYNLKPAKPVLDAEPNYEDHPVNPWPKWDPKNGYYVAYDVRKQLYRSVFAGACGVTYGHHAVWQFYSPREEKVNYPDRYWTNAINRPGAFQAGYLRKLIESRPYLNRIPDDSLIAAGQGEKGSHMTAFRESSGAYLMVYSPKGTPFSVNTSKLAAKHIKVSWFDPRKGEFLASKKISVGSNPITSFIPPQGAGNNENDWVLVLDAIIKGD